MSATSMPRAATSVATSTWEAPRAKPSRAPSRSCCGRSPCMQSTPPNPSAERSRASAAQPALVLTKTRALASAEPARASRSLRMARRRPGLSASPSTSTRCSTVRTATGSSPHAPWPMLTCTGESRKSAARARTAAGHVALNSSVRRPAGRAWKISRTWGSKPMSSIRSASSSTTVRASPRSHGWRCTRRMSRPGVDTRRCTPCAMLSRSLRMSVPP
mmetsp:Transcript_6356/g.21740  ORF Transcript_6356/g.21740 Transcript_6356/m.21740 type:complete len:217 (-) Transcript_6356:458-1108(-)